ncbi:hypothetical protein M3P36_01995 [Altererythrobacter sp. KTW20L]|uniref:hypothetical protein n=1 Tax=Altererythrobacter sp. KTW20L TaxID=2942210 RepID=UPI0020C0B878|nr:hypothetical protein [Altererythrobacter sp. KTW20L]MCL6249821.1 hypothetical protein [Altererythrobacter sp. KTW20L]
MRRRPSLRAEPVDGLLPLFGAGVAVLALIGLSAWLGFGGRQSLEGPDEALALAGELRGFTPNRLVLDRDGGAALVGDTLGRIALVAPHGAHFIAREIGPEARLDRTDGELSIAIGAMRVILALGDEAASWESLVSRAIAPAETGP